MSRHKFTDGDGQNKVVDKNASYIISTKPFPGTLTEMAADALLLTIANEGKRWQATNDSDRIYSYRLVGTTWDYYLESGTDSFGNIRTTIINSATSTQVHPRERISVTTAREVVRFTAEQAVKAITFTVLDTVAAASDANAALAVCFDAFDDNEADLWLTESDLEAFDTQRFIIPLGESNRIYTFAEPVSRIDFKAIGAETLRVFIGGA